jgi:hypothetical protein
VDVNDVISFIKKSTLLKVKQDYEYSFVFDKGNSNEYISQQGYIYCYAIELTKSEAKDVFDIVKKENRVNNKLKTFDEWTPFKVEDEASLYNLYVGETENLTARTRSHINGFEGCGGIRLNELPEVITKKSIQFAAIQVHNVAKERKKIENELNSISRSLLKTISTIEKIAKELL